MSSANYSTEFLDGLQAGALLMQAGADPGELLAAIGADGDPRECQDRLGELRRIMGTDNIVESRT